jgi:hypothetical protein
MKLTQPQQVICESLIAEAATITEIANNTRFSTSYVRAQIKQLETNGRIEKVDKRQPYMYQLTKDNPFVLVKDRIDKYRYLLENIDAPTENSFVKLLRQADKEDWPTVADELRAIVEVIDMLEADGKLINTLEGLLQ